MTFRSTKIFAVMIAAASSVLASPASAKRVCGWYAIAYCSANEAAAERFAKEVWGGVISTNNYDGFARGQFCVVSGPRSKSEAAADRAGAISAGAADDAYIKRACSEEAYEGE